MADKAKRPRKAKASELPSDVRRVSVPAPLATGMPRRSRRRLISGTLVEVDAPTVSDKPWVVDAVDVNADGMGLVLPRALRPGTDVLLTFRLDESCVFSRVPAVVLHREPQAGGGGVRFRAWPDADRLRLLEHLVRFYEAAGT